jgi:ATP/maltotriose-dependent transcriptional regulator MalT
MTLQGWLNRLPEAIVTARARLCLFRATTLVITHDAIGTVKRHLNNIYGKLGAHSRTQALARTRDLRLI